MNIYKNISIFLQLVLIIIFSTKFNTTKAQTLEEGINFCVDFINSRQFKSIRDSSSDKIAIDSLFESTLNFYNGNTSESLLALTFSTLPFEKMPLTIPLINLKFGIKLPSGAPENVHSKIKNLPSRFFFDTPKGKMGDSDKMPHFFGSAYLSFSERIFNISKFMGILVELFEESFEVQGQIDTRDLQIDNLGIIFGKLLRSKKKIVPSNIFSIYELYFIKFNIR